MTAPLARDQYGNPVELPAEAKLWRVRRHTRGRPADIMGPTGEPLYVAITDDQPDLRANGCTGAIRLDAVDGDRRALPVQAVYVELGTADEAPRVAANDGDKEMVRVCFDSMTRTMEGMQRAQVERERTLAQKEHALTEAQISSQKMMVELMIALLDRVGGAKPQDALSVLKQQFEIQRTLEKQSARNAPAPPDPSPVPEQKGDMVPGWVKTALPMVLMGVQELAVNTVAKGDEGKAQAVRNLCGGILSAITAGGAAPNQQPAPVAPVPTPVEEKDEVVRRVAPKAMREVLALLSDDEAVAMESLLVNLDDNQYLAVCAEADKLPDLDARLLWARQVIAREATEDQAGAPRQAEPSARHVEVPGVPAALMPVLAQLTAEEQVLGFQLLSWLDRATTENVIANLSALPPDQALARVRSMIDEARKRGPSVAHRAVASVLAGSPKNGAPGHGGAE